MLPFSQLLVYSNKISQWYTGSEVIAYDSNIFNASGFTDYTGKTISLVSNPFGIAGTAPVLYTGTADPSYGSGIQMNTGSLGNIGLDVGYLTSDWCVDLLVKYTTIGTTNDYLPFYPLMNDNNKSGGSYLDFQCNSSGSKYLSRYQNSQFVDIQYYFNELRTSTYNHFAMQYDFTNKILYTFVNGTMVKSTSITYTQPAPTHGGFLWGNYRSRSSSSCVIDRYRIRKGKYFNPNGFDIKSIYPGTTY